MDLKIGCCGIPISIREYMAKFRTAELDETFYNLPNLDTAADWKKKAPKGFVFTLKAEPSIAGSSFATNDEVLRAWERTDDLATSLGARIIVFDTPALLPEDEAAINNMKEFFRSIDRTGYKIVWVPNDLWDKEDIRTVCRENDLIHAVDPFREEPQHGPMRYYRLKGLDDRGERYKGLDMKKLRDLCQEEGKKTAHHTVYVFFNNVHKLHDALRFDWICEHTGPIREINVSFLENLCGEIESREEDENVQRLSREAEKIVSLILHTEYAKIDIEIEKTKLRELCKELFPEKEYLYDMIYGNRFDRLWEQFREEEREQ